MKYKVVIPAAGTGSRLGGMTKYLNKSLVSLGNKPTISRIIESFPTDTEFVIATGYKGELVKEYISLAHPELKVTFVDILLYEGEGSGLGLSLLSCKDYLQEPFVFCSCDCLIAESIPEPTENWMGYDHRDSREQYRTICADDGGMILSIDEKGSNLGEKSEPYIGLAGIHDYKAFWTAMESGGDAAIIQGESYGLRFLLNEGIVARKFTWFDTGVKIELQATRKRFEDPSGPNILEKPNEAIWFVNGKVIKFSDDTQFISDRVKRAKLLKGFVPKVTGRTTHMYAYDYVAGDVVSKCVSLPLFRKLLDFSKDFWQHRTSEHVNLEEFREQCYKFYKEKTYKRIGQFYGTFDKADSALVINGVTYPKLVDLMDNIDWDYISNGLPGQFHGDYHFENIIYNKENDSFEFLDWRQNFGNSLEIGDIYYDFAKLNHGLIISHELIAKNMFSAKWEENSLVYDFARKQSLIDCEQEFYKWLQDNGYDVKKVKIMTALIFLNICALHDYPYVLLLYGLGKKMLFDALQMTD